MKKKTLMKSKIAVIAVFFSSEYFKKYCKQTILVDLMFVCLAKGFRMRMQTMSFVRQF